MRRHFLVNVSRTESSILSFSNVVNRVALIANAVKEETLKHKKGLVSTQVKYRNDLAPQVMASLMTCTILM